MALVIVSVLLVVVYQIAQSRVECDWVMTQGLLRQQREQQEEMRNLRDDNRELAEEVVRTGRGAQIDDAATSAMQDTMQQQQAEIAEMKEQLTFFRGIVEPEESAAGLRIQRVEVWRGQEPRVYHFSLILIQSVRNENKVSGTVALTIQGVQGGKSKEVGLSGLLVKPRPSMGFKFRYFQEIDGAFILPKGFDPGKVQAVVSRSGEESLTVRESYDWQDILQNTGAQ